MIFDRPDTSAFAQGTLYYDYGGKNEVAFSRSTLANGTFYYGGSYDEDNAEYDLDDLTFVAGRNFKDDVTLSFRAYYSSSRYVDGTLTITTGKSASTSTITGEIRYAATYGSRVQINANDIARYFSKSYPGYTLQYVTLGGVPATGSLYYNYYSASRYGTSSSLRLTSSNYNSQVLYFSPVSTAQYALTELTYVPSGNNYCDVIPFTAYGSGSRSISGNILISVNSSTVSEVYGVTQRNTAVSFPASAIYSAVSSATGVSLASIQLLSLPSASQGTVYVGSVPFGPPPIPCTPTAPVPSRSASSALFPSAPSPAPCRSPMWPTTAAERRLPRAYSLWGFSTPPRASRMSPPPPGATST